MRKTKLLDSPLVVPKSVGLTRVMSELAEKMSKRHKARSVSDYIRGLILLDAFIVEGAAENARPSDLPEWFMNEYTPEFLRNVKAEYAAQKKGKSGPKGVVLDDLERW